ncbi:UNVERIFIED_CONTAM: hypothetical protein FKN15_057739 [Acipenser sinensis]
MFYSDKNITISNEKEVKERESTPNAHKPTHRSSQVRSEARLDNGDTAVPSPEEESSARSLDSGDTARPGPEEDTVKLSRRKDNSFADDCTDMSSVRLLQYTAELYTALGLARQQAQALAVAPAQPIALALEQTPPAPVVAPDVTCWRLPYSPGCPARRMVYQTGLKEHGFHVAIRPAHRKRLHFTLQGSVLSFLCCGSTSP